MLNICLIWIRKLELVLCIGAFTILKNLIGYESLGSEEPLQTLCFEHAIYVEGLPIWYSK
jgi:hypothetical protein